MSLRNKLRRLESRIIDTTSDCFCGKTFLHLHTDLDFSKLVPCRFCEKQALAWHNLFKTAAREIRAEQLKNSTTQPLNQPTQEKNNDD